MISIKNLSFGYIKKPLCIVNLNLEILDNQTVAILGGEGMGKTSLLRVISGLENQYVGSVFFDEKNASEIPIENRKISFLPSVPVLIENKTVRQNIEYLLKIEKIEISDEELVKILNKFNFNSLIDVKVKKLENYQKKILSIIRAYIKNQKYILIDDMFKNETEEKTVLIKNAILLLKNDKNIPIIFVFEDKMHFLCDKYVYLSYSKSYEFDDINKIKSSFIDMFVSNYFSFNSLNLIITKVDDEYYFCEYEINENKKRKNQTFSLKNHIKIDKNNKKYFDGLSLMEDEILKIKLIKNDKKYIKFSEEKINQYLAENSVHVFEFDTGVKIV